MTGMKVVEFFQDEVQFPYGVIRRVSAPVGTLFLLLTDFLIPSNSDSVDLSFALLYNGHVSD